MGSPRGQGVFVLALIFLVLAFIAFTLRLLTRTLIARNAGRDDVCIAVGLLCSFALTVTIGIQVHNGLGRHQEHLTDDQVTSLLRAFWFSLWLYYLGLCFTKCGLILQYLRIFTQRWFRIAAWTIFGIVVVYSVWTVLSSIFSCTPVHAFWDQSVKDARCMPHGVSWFVNAGINIATDLATVILPMPVVRKLQLPNKQRYALMAVFALGSFVCIVSMIRIKSLVEISSSSDVSYANPPAAAWSAIELNVGIICASLPSLKSMVTRYFPRFLSGRSSNGSHGPITDSNPHPSSRRLTVGSVPSRWANPLKSKGNPATSRTNQSFLRSHASVRSKGDRDTELAMIDKYGPNQINVVTVVEQEVENARSGGEPSSSAAVSRSNTISPLHDWDTDSEKGLFPYDGRQSPTDTPVDRYSPPR